MKKKKVKKRDIFTCHRLTIMRFSCHKTGPEVPIKNWNKRIEHPMKFKLDLSNALLLYINAREWS